VARNIRSAAENNKFMPELPEVETITRDLRSLLIGQTIDRVEVLDKKLVPQGNKKFISLLNGKKIKLVDRRAKMLFFQFIDKSFLVVHLKMTGQLVYTTQNRIISGGHPIINLGSELPNKFTKVIISFKNNSSLFFNDIRRFGWMKALTADEFLILSDKFGVEPFSPEFSLASFREILSRKKKSPIKLAIMDQKLLVGIGNIYADESLFDAHIRPTREASSLSQVESRRLWVSIKKLLRLAISHRGTSFSDYVDARGMQGNFVEYLKVYGRAKKKCRSCGTEILKIKLGGRGTHWCPVCQK
jgi:formamidopyrimidine-DNA glycosylase